MSGTNLIWHRKCYISFSLSAMMKITHCYCCIRQILWYTSLALKDLFCYLKNFFFEWNFLIWKDIFRSRSLLLSSFDWFRYKLKNVMNLRILLWKAFKSLLTSFFFCRSRWLNEMWGYFEGWLVDMDYQRIELRGFLKWSFIFV